MGQQDPHLVFCRLVPMCGFQDGDELPVLGVGPAADAWTGRTENVSGELGSQISRDQEMNWKWARRPWEEKESEGIKGLSRGDTATAAGVL